MKNYVVTMYRYGNREKHSYVLGIYSTEKTAIMFNDVEEAWRADKYEGEILEFEVDNKDIDYTPRVVKGLKNS